MLQDLIQSALHQASQCLTALQGNVATLDAIEQAGHQLAAAFRNGHKVMSCGNGGSMCDAMHFAEELTGRFREDRPGLPAVAIADASYLSCVGNDYGYHRVFSRYVESWGHPGDVLLAISTSGTSSNVLEALKMAKHKQVHTILLTGKSQGPMLEWTDTAIITPGGRYADRVQELHIKIIHILIECVESVLFAQPQKS